MNAMISGAGSDRGDDHGNDLHGGAPGADWHDLGPRDACFADAPCMQATVNGVKVGLFLVDDEVYAIDDLCTHGHAMLTDGELDGFEVECPLHGGVFDVRSGKPLCSPVTRPVRTHPVRFYQGGVYVKVEG